MFVVDKLQRKRSNVLCTAHQAWCLYTVDLSGHADAGADVIMAVRSVDKAKEVAGDIKKSNEKHGSDGKLEVMHVDLNSLESVRKFAQNFNDTHKQLNVLITNAGVVSLRHQAATTCVRHGACSETA